MLAIANTALFGVAKFAFVDVWLPIARQEVASAEEALRLTQKNLQIGTGLTLDVLAAEDAAYQARLHHATASVHYNQAEVNLLAALGLIDELRVEGKTIGGRTSAPRPDK